MRSSLIATVALVMDFLDRISEKIFKKSRADRSSTVYLPDNSPLAGILVALIFTAFGIVFPIFGDVTMWFLSSAFFIFALFGVALVIAYFNCRITFRDQDFTYKTFFGVKKTIQYRDLTGIHERNSDIKLYAGDNVIFVASYSVNGDRFLALAKKRYREHHNGKMIPRTAKKDIFNNHVDEPQSIVLIFIILGVLVPLMSIGVISFSTPDSREDFSERFITVEKYEISDGDLYIYDSRDIEYRVYNYNDIIDNSSELISKLSRGSSVGLLIKPIDSDEDRYSVSDIKVNGRSYLTFDKWHENQVQNFIVVIVIFAVIHLMILFFVGGTIYVGRNPHKFSDRVIHIFFKPGTIRMD